MRFLVESTFAQAPTPQLLALIPAETARGLELDAQGVREALYVAADNSRAWQVFQVESRAALDDTLASLPLHPYLAIVVTPLAEAQTG
jgi:muconolactone delta-isomerase